MRIGIFTLGSRGDVQPYIALAMGLQQQGFEVVLASYENFREFVESFGVPFYGVKGDVQALINAPEGQSLLKERSGLRILHFFAQSQDSGHSIVPFEFLEGCKQVDFIITGYLTTFTIATIAEKLGKKWAIVHVGPPMIATEEAPVMNLDFANYRSYNLWSYKFLDWIHWRLYKKKIVRLRKHLGLPPLTKSLPSLLKEQGILTLHAVSPSLYKKPKDWPAHALITGFLTLSNSTKPGDQKLIQWLKSGPKPIYMGFGSIPFPDKERLVYTITELLLSYRIVFVKGWFDIEELPEHPNLYVLSQVSHEWLLPQCRVAVIHGGIGTLTAVLRAEIMPIVVSIFADQPYWGRMIDRKKLGCHIPWRKLSAAALVNALSKETVYAKEAASLGKKIKKEDGISHATQALTAYWIAEGLLQSADKNQNTALVTTQQGTNN